MSIRFGLLTEPFLLHWLVWLTHSAENEAPQCAFAVFHRCAKKKPDTLVSGYIVCLFQAMLSDKEQLFRLLEIPCTNPIEIHTTCQACRVELGLMVTNIHLPIDELLELLAEDVEDAKSHV